MTKRSFKYTPYVKSTMSSTSGNPRSMPSATSGSAAAAAPAAGKYQPRSLESNVQEPRQQTERSQSDRQIGSNDKKAETISPSYSSKPKSISAISSESLSDSKEEDITPLKQTTPPANSIATAATATATGKQSTCVLCSGPHKFSPFNVTACGLAVLPDFVPMMIVDENSGHYIVCAIRNPITKGFHRLTLGDIHQIGSNTVPFQKPALYWSDGLEILGENGLISMLVQCPNMVNSTTIENLLKMINCPQWWDTFLSKVASIQIDSDSFANSIERASSYRDKIFECTGMPEKLEKYALIRDHSFPELTRNLRSLREKQKRINEAQQQRDSIEAKRKKEEDACRKLADSEAAILERLTRELEEVDHDVPILSFEEAFVNELTASTRKGHTFEFVAAINPDSNVFANIVQKAGDKSDLQSGVDTEDKAKKAAVWDYYLIQEAELKKSNGKKYKDYTKGQKKSDAPILDIPTIPTDHADFKRLDTDPRKPRPLLILTKPQQNTYQKIWSDFNAKANAVVSTSGPGFILDPWQAEAIDLIRTNKCVLITGPTSGGKTYVMMKGMDNIINGGSEQLVIYVAPTFHLAYQKFADVKATFPKRTVAMITAELISIPSGANIIIGTAPQLLNYFVTTKKTFQVGIFDEIHVASNAYYDASSKSEVIRAKAYSRLISRCEKQLIVASATIEGIDEMRKFLAHQMNYLRKDDEPRMTYTDINHVNYTVRAVPLNEYRFVGNSTIEPLVRDLVAATSVVATSVVATSVVATSDYGDDGIIERLQRETADALPIMHDGIQVVWQNSDTSSGIIKETVSEKAVSEQVDMSEQVDVSELDVSEQVDDVAEPDITSENLFKLLAEMKKRDMTPAILFDATDDIAWKTYVDLINFVETQESIEYKAFTHIIEKTNDTTDKFNIDYYSRMDALPDSDNTDSSKMCDGKKGNGRREAGIRAIRANRMKIYEAMISDAKTIFIRSVHSYNKENPKSLCDVPLENLPREVIAKVAAIFGSKTSDLLKTFPNFHMSRAHIDMMKIIRTLSDADSDQAEPIPNIDTNKGSYFRFANSCGMEQLKAIREPGSDQDSWKQRKTMITLAEAQNINPKDIDAIIDMVMRGLEFGIAIINPSLPFVIQNIILENLRTKNMGVVIASESMSMGINYGLRSVIIKSETGSVSVNPGKMIQMAGRCGRRGKDTQAHVIYWGISNAEEAHPSCIPPLTDYTVNFFISNGDETAGSMINDQLELATELGSLFNTFYFYEERKKKVLPVSATKNGGRVKISRHAAASGSGTGSGSRLSHTSEEDNDEERERKICEARAANSSLSRCQYIVPTIQKLAIRIGYTRDEADAIAEMIEGGAGKKDSSGGKGGSGSGSGSGGTGRSTAPATVSNSNAARVQTVAPNYNIRAAPPPAQVQLVAPVSGSVSGSVSGPPERVDFCCYCNLDDLSCIPEAERERERNVMGPASLNQLPEAPLDNHRFSAYRHNQICSSNSNNGCPIVVFKTDGRRKHFEFVKSTKSKKYCQIKPSELERVHGLSSNLCSAVAGGAAASSDDEQQLSHIFSRGSMFARTLMRHIIMDPTLIAMDEFELYASSILCDRFWYDIYMNEFFDGPDKRAVYNGGLVNILQRLESSPLYNLCIIKREARLNSLRDSQKAAKDKAAEQKTQKAVKDAEEAKNRNTELEVKTEEVFRQKIEELMSGSSTAAATERFRTALSNRTESGAGARRAPLSRLNINSNLLKQIVEEIGTKSDMEKMSKDKALDEIVYKALRGEGLNKGPAALARIYIASQGYDVNDYDKKIREAQEDLKELLKANKRKPRPGTASAAAMAVAASSVSSETESDMSTCVSTCAAVATKAGSAKAESAIKLASGKKPLIIADFKYESSGPTFDPWQKRLVDNIKDSKSCIVSVPTGGGKTFAMMNAINIIILDQDNNERVRGMLRKSLAYIAPSFHLALQTYANLVKTFPNLKISLITENIVSEIEDATIFVGTPIALANYTRANNKLFNIGIFDEIHLISPSYVSNSFERSRATNMLFLLTRCIDQVICASATIPNLDDLDHFIQDRVLTNVHDLLRIATDISVDAAVVAAKAKARSELKQRGKDGLIAKYPELTGLLETLRQQNEALNTILSTLFDPSSPIDRRTIDATRDLVYNNQKRHVNPEKLEKSRALILGKLRSKQSDASKTDVVLISEFITKPLIDAIRRLDLTIQSYNAFNDSIMSFEKAIEYTQRALPLIEFVWTGSTLSKITRYPDGIIDKSESVSVSSSVAPAVSSSVAPAPAPVVPELDISSGFPIDETKLIKLFRSLSRTEKLPALVFEDTEDNAFKSFCAVVYKLSKDQKNMYSIRDSIAREINSDVDAYNLTNIEERLEYAEREKTNQSSKGGSKGGSKSVQPVKVDQYYTTRDKAIESLKRSIGKLIVQIVTKINQNRSSPNDTYPIVVLTERRKTLLLKILSIGRSQIPESDLTHNSGELSEIMDYYLDLQQIANSSTIDYPSPLPPLLTDIGKNLRIAGSGKLDGIFGNFLINSEEERNRDRDMARELAKSEGSYRQDGTDSFDFTHSTVRALIKLFKDGASFGVTCIIPNLPMFIQIEVTKALKRAKSSNSSSIGIVFASTSMSIGIDYSLRSVVIKAPNNSVAATANFDPTTMIQMAGRCGRRGTDDEEGNVIYYGISNYESANGKLICPLDLDDRKLDRRLLIQDRSIESSCIRSDTVVSGSEVSTGPAVSARSEVSAGPAVSALEQVPVEVADGETLYINYWMVELFKLSHIPDSIDFSVTLADGKIVEIKKPETNRNVKLALIKLLQCIKPNITEIDAKSTAALMYDVANTPWKSEYLLFITDLQNNLNDMMMILFEMINRNYKIISSDRFYDLIQKMIALLRRLEINIIKNSCKESSLGNASSSIFDLGKMLSSLMSIIINDKIKWNSGLGQSQVPVDRGNADSVEALNGLPSQVIRAGVRYQIDVVDGDGDCMFNAILGQEHTNEATYALRKEAIAYIRQTAASDPEYRARVIEAVYDWYGQNITHPELTRFSVLSPLEGINRYLEILGKRPEARQTPGRLYWGSFLEMHAIAMIRNIRINLINANVGPADNNRIYQIPEPDDRDGNIPIVSIYFNSVHFSRATLIAGAGVSGSGSGVSGSGVPGSGDSTGSSSAGSKSSVTAKSIIGMVPRVGDL